MLNLEIMENTDKKAYSGLRTIMMIERILGYSKN